jgi:hypothetical protein
LRALNGVGSKALGQWEDDRAVSVADGAYHVRRRLTPAEQTIVGGVVDIRGTIEASIRAQRIVDHYRGRPMELVIRQAARAEIGD